GAICRWQQRMRPMVPHLVQRLSSQLRRPVRQSCRNRRSICASRTLLSNVFGATGYLFFSCRPLVSRVSTEPIPPRTGTSGSPTSASMTEIMVALDQLKDDTGCVVR
ncbi:hypothetical protein, partial [Burkholderia sp. L27(2015)]|uniref:hypothetical protein n=1 Tax=Burkholderia sp. L27(2015) TaxID=1641858 RepID=UPI001C203430